MTKAEIIKAICNKPDYRFTHDEMMRMSKKELLEYYPEYGETETSEDLEKVVMIDNVIMNMTAEGYNNGYKTRPFYEEVLRRLNARKEEEK